MRTMHGGGSAPSCCSFTHWVACEEGSGQADTRETGRHETGRHERQAGTRQTGRHKRDRWTRDRQVGTREARQTLERQADTRETGGHEPASLKNSKAQIPQNKLGKGQPTGKGPLVPSTCAGDLRKV